MNSTFEGDNLHVKEYSIIGRAMKELADRSYFKQGF